MNIKFKIAGLAFLSLGLVGCATVAKQTDSLLQAPPQIPVQFEIPNMPFVEQTSGYCGPATLAMVMQWTGLKISVNEIAPQVFTPGMQGSLQSDMISAGRRNGLMVIPIEGLSSLLTEVAAGHPVIIFENLGLSWAPTWHYAVVFGYNLQKEVVIMHSGPERSKHWDMRHFERSWMLGDYWGVVVLPPSELSATANELAHLTAASALENLGKSNESEVAYHKILQRWPMSSTALIGLGNLAYAKKRYREAVHHLCQAVSADPNSSAAKHNLVVAKKAAKVKSCI